MRLGGYQKLTLIDYPGKIATTVFTVGCSFRCPFCHNPELVLSSQLTVHGVNIEKEFFEFLKKRRGKLEGVCVTGGEPTIQPDLIQFIKKLKRLGFLVKLDTNGTRPDVLKRIIDAKLVDYIAMDIKNSQEKYLETAGVEVRDHTSLLDRIKLSVELIKNSRIPYEFRTTAVPGLHTEKDFKKIACWIKGTRTYSLQKFQDTKILDPALRIKIKGKKLNLEKIKNRIKRNFGAVKIKN